MARFPPPMAPGAGQVLWDALGEVEEGPLLDFVEVFAGHAAVSRAFQSLGYRGRRMDLKYHEGHDVLNPTGLLLLLSSVMDLKPGGILWAAPPCSTWVFLSRSSTGRDVQVEGNTLSRSVLGQNALVERLVLVLEVCALKGVYWILEQPANSVLWQYPAMRDCLDRQGAQSCALEMGAYGAQSVKPTTLMGTAPFLRELERKCSKELRHCSSNEGVVTTTKWTDTQGRKRCQGTDQLKGTQQYPEGFGAAVALAFKDHELGADVAMVGERRGPSRRAQLTRLREALPAAVSTDGARWLRDFMGEPW